MNKSNRELWRWLVDKYQRQLILMLDAFVGGIQGGFLNALGLTKIAPETFHMNNSAGWKSLALAAIWGGIVGAGQYLHRRGAIIPPSSSSVVPPSP